MCFFNPAQVLGLLFCLLISQSVFANDTTYLNRLQAYRDTALLETNEIDIVAIQAYNSGVVDTNLIRNTLDRIEGGSTFDFQLVKLVRVLFLTNGAYDNMILSALDTVPFWLTKSDTIRGYWSENHTIMWMSSDWLLHEKFGKTIDAGLHQRLLHYLNLKIKYGFYEFYSPTYAPYCFSGLVNLADFAQDQQIKSLATQAAVRLLRDLLLMTNDKGAMFAVAGRAYPGNYEGAYNRNHAHLIYLLTGMGQVPSGTSHSGSFLCTSSLEVDSIVSTFTTSLDTTFYIGHSIDSSLIINSVLRPLDKVISQWSSGLYFHPKVAYETGSLLKDSMLWHHVDFQEFIAFENFGPADIQLIAESLPAISMSSPICGQQISLFKRNSVTLSSVYDFWKGKVGYQQYPLMANLGTTAVYTGSGLVKEVWTQRSSNNQNDHLPYVAQSSNVALVMYRAEPNNILLKSKDVALHFKDADFDEVRNAGLWVLGRQGESYVAARRYCDSIINNVRACGIERGQSWVIVVGDSSMYGNFNNFEGLVNQSQFTDSWYYDSINEQSVYYASVTFDTTTIDYAWRVDSLISSVNEIPDAGGFKVYPNPTQSEVTIELDNHHQPATITVYNLVGQLMYNASFTTGVQRVATGTWPEGMYMIQIEQGGQRHMQKLLKAN